MILIKSRLRSFSIKIELFKKDVQKILDRLGYSDFDLGILLTTNKTIRRYNKEFRNKDKATDVLSFPFYPDLKAEQIISAKTDAEKNLGDIIISLERVENDAKNLGIPFEKYLRRILVHGICHLIGYTHDTEKNYCQMQKKESKLLDLINVYI